MGRDESTGLGGRDLESGQEKNRRAARQKEVSTIANRDEGLNVPNRNRARGRRYREIPAFGGFCIRRG